MNKLKQFWTDHKTKILVIGGGVVVATISYALFHNRKAISEFAGENVIHWVPGNETMNLEEVKEILELNKDNASSFAIFREGPDPSKFVTILLSDDVEL